MVIPGTNQVDTSNVDLHHPENELFSFMVSDIEADSYLADYIHNLDQHLPGFAFSRKTLECHEKNLQEGKTSVSAIDRARALLQKTTLENVHNSGEFGELLLYLFARYVKKAQKLVSKIQDRGSGTMTIPGRDGIFLWEDEEKNIYMLTGEAKVRPDSNDGLREAQGDINKFWANGNISHEIQLASNHLRDELTADNVSLYETYFIDDNENHKNLRYKNIIFVGYNLNSFKTLREKTISYEDFVRAIKDDFKRCYTNQKQLIEASTQTSVYCFMPFECVDAARITFAEHNQLLI